MRLFFATDLHGSEICFRKFVAAASFYNASTLFLGGDLAGKAVVHLWRDGVERWESYANGEHVLMRTRGEKAAFVRNMADQGFYVFETERDEFAALSCEQKTVIIHRLICERLSQWIDYATAKLEPLGVRIIAIAGNDDPPAIDSILSSSSVITMVDGTVVVLDEEIQILGYGYSTPTPWHTYREQEDDVIARALQRLEHLLSPNLPVIFHVHVPPYDSGLDVAPSLDNKLKPIIGPGGPMLTAVGSRAVHDAVLRVRPVLGLFGHVHEARSVTKLGATLCVNPGSTYSQGRLSGFIATLSQGKVRDWQLTEG